PAAGAPAAGAPAAPVAAQAEPGAETSDLDLPLPGEDVNQGLLVVIRDRQTGESTLRRLDFAPQRPRRYVRVEVGYNLNAEQLHVTVTGQSPDLLPADGVKVRAEIVEPLPQTVQARLEGELKAPDYQAVLYANIPAVPRRTVTLRVHVDDYPRAFVFRVPCGVHSRSLPEEEHLMQVRIVSPQANKAFQAPVESVRVRAEVDAPVGTFQNGNDLVEIGLDEDLDREFRSDAPLRFHNDRQADVRLTGLRPGGLLLVQTRVRDFVVDVPGNGLQNVRVNVLGRLFVRQKTAWSLPVPISLDAAAPNLARVKTAGGNQAIIGQPLLITVWGDGEDLSLMGGVEAAFDTERTGEFPLAPPPVPGKPVGDGRWEITLPTEQLTPGRHNLLLRARDRVGNQGKILSYEVQAIPEAELQKQRETLVLVTGRVLYREQPVPGATVGLKAADGKEYGPVQTDEQGQYRIENVPVGSYQVDARGVVRNTPRFPAEPITFEIKQGDPRLKRLDIPIRPNRAPGGAAEPR
ncbi:MAG: carboxypeptidase regulatory-like domain-containing protein, partial [Pirellulaceae bacterium]|nr:carboxypeptidase regulatory-like domain-containing protein [Pirellulaceae bacterium]